MINAIGNFIGAPALTQSDTPAGDWLLETGFWDDNGVWQDSATWTDPPYNVNYQIIMAQANSEAITLPSEAQMTKDSDFLTAISSIWSKVKGMKMFKHDGTRTSGFSLIDWKNPSTNRAVLVNSPTLSNNGWNGNGTSSYVNSGIPVSVITQSSACYFAKGFTNTGTAGSYLFGASNANAGSTGSIFCNPRNSSNNMTYQCSNTSVTTVSNSDATVRICVGRSGLTNYYSFNGAAKTTTAISNDLVAPGTRTFYLLADNGVTTTGFNARGISYFIVCDDLNNSEIAIMDAALATWLS